MALTPTIRGASGAVRTLVSGLSDESRASRAGVRSLVNFPSEEIHASQTFARTLTVNDTVIRSSQAIVRVIARGRVDSPKIRTWTFTLDNHDFYVVRLGGLGKTLIYDVFAEQWYIWGSGDAALWRAFDGSNWIGGRRLRPDQSNIVVGDDGNGALYFLSPDDDTDDDALTGAETPRPFTRKLTGQVIVGSGYAAVPCFGVQLFGSIGSGATLDVQLEVSDDRGATYVDVGSITLTEGTYTARVHWQSLGSMTAPGRLFRITDIGALKRIDKLFMDEPDAG